MEMDDAGIKVFLNLTHYVQPLIGHGEERIPEDTDDTENIPIHRLLTRRQVVHPSHVSKARKF